MSIKTIEDIRLLISNAVEESTEMEYKRSFADDKQKRREDIAKDISAMANANGGIIIYGLNQKETTKEHAIPEEIKPIPSDSMSKDQLAQIISSNISPRIKDIEITYIPYNQEGGIFVVEVPKSQTAHQNLTNHLYHIRRNATIEIMEDFEIRDIMNRQANPPLSIDGCGLYKMKSTETKDEYEFMAKITNDGYSVCQTYKLNIYLNKVVAYCHIKFPVHEGFSYTALDEKRLKISCNCMEPIFPNETLEMGHFNLIIPHDKEKEYLTGLIIDMILFYPGGTNDVAYIPNEKRYVIGRNKIDTLLGRDKIIDYPMLEVRQSKRD
ncbi:AlbA family DNA-binding domain-containing protein [Phocaeicola oris]|uniref:AlbA family DNA-binding domain-containing protein n=1 Tax=Phocaeicola oris TaxID=2896850 RepID=UPI00234F0CF2|nr:ATP-binding protein [Phocaeicola oris]MCE2617121.1 ATP-binding protein [Phocaeicola oris]